MVGSRDGCCHSIAEGTVQWCDHISFSKFSVPKPRCFRALLHNLQPASDRCLIFASHVATGMILAIAIISRLLCPQGTRGSFKYFTKNALLFILRNMKSAVHVPYVGVIDIVLLCTSLHTLFQECSVINSSVQLQDLKHALIRCLISLLVCAVLYVITFAPSVISPPECVHLSLSTCKPLFMLLHLILCCPSSYCISQAIITCRSW